MRQLVIRHEGRWRDRWWVFEGAGPDGETLHYEPGEVYETEAEALRAAIAACELKASEMRDRIEALPPGDRPGTAQGNERMTTARGRFGGMSLSLYAGSFDPITKGHEWVIANAPHPLIVAVADNPGKTYRFSIEARAEMVRRSVGSDAEVVVVGNGYLVDFATKAGAHFIIRGVRSVADYEYERGYADVNRTIDPGPVHLLMMPPPELASVSSSVVRSLVGPEGWEAVVSRYVSPHVLEALRG